MHIRYIRSARAATPVLVPDDADLFGSLSVAENTLPLTSRATALPPAQTLWARQALALPTGRVLGLRIRAGSLKVAFQPCDQQGREGLRWVDPTAVMTHKQAQAWATWTQFHPD